MKDYSFRVLWKTQKSRSVPAMLTRRVQQLCSLQPSRCRAHPATVSRNIVTHSAYGSRSSSWLLPVLGQYDHYLLWSSRLLSHFLVASQNVLLLPPRVPRASHHRLPYTCSTYIFLNTAGSRAHCVYLPFPEKLGSHYYTHQQDPPVCSRLSFGTLTSRRPRCTIRITGLHLQECVGSLVNRGWLVLSSSQLSILPVPHLPTLNVYAQETVCKHAVRTAGIQIIGCSHCWPTDLKRVKKRLARVCQIR